jgi:hypothetical protein
MKVFSVTVLKTLFKTIRVLPDNYDLVKELINFLKRGEEEMFKKVTKEDLDYILKRLKY